MATDPQAVMMATWPIRLWDEEGDCNNPRQLQPGSGDTRLILYLSLALGSISFITFCILRPRWKSLYSARSQRFNVLTGLPPLPNSFFGWIPTLYRITDEQVLASAGLDAFVFLNFFKMAMRLFFIMALFASVILMPINTHFVGPIDFGKPGNGSDGGDSDGGGDSGSDGEEELMPWGGGKKKPRDNSYLLAYLVFTYFFTYLAWYFLNRETHRVIRIRQDYLGTQSTVTDRTFRLTGIPRDLKSEAKLKQLVEELDVGQVESVSLCRDWGSLDRLVQERHRCLRRLELAWSQFRNTAAQSTKHTSIRSEEPPLLGNGRGANSGTGYSDTPDDTRNGSYETQPIAVAEEERLLGTTTGDVEDEETAMLDELDENNRPKIRIWYGFLRLQNRTTDAIDYYEEKLGRLDDKIREARRRTYPPADLAFVTMDSVTSCQMAIQALIDPRPGVLLTKPAPSPPDVVWENTYAPRGVRRLRSWLITALISLLSILWLIIVASLASLVSICTLEKWFPRFVQYLANHEWLLSLVRDALPALAVSGLNSAVPFLYDYLSYRQGMVSKDQIEMSFISKNFFFTFFNIFVVFALTGTSAQLLTLIRLLDKPSMIPETIARSFTNVTNFYASFVLLQGMGLTPFRLLEPGGIWLFLSARLTAKTPRDRAEMTKPPVFSYGYYLPTALVVFIICLVYSVMPKGAVILAAGWLYFALGYFTYKYQLLYAMDQPQHATGGAWIIISYRIILGLVVFQVLTASYIALQKEYYIAITIVPLIIVTAWSGYYVRRRFAPLTRFIALRSVRVGDEEIEDSAVFDDEAPAGVWGTPPTVRRGSTLDEERERGLKFINPSFKIPLSGPWILDEPPADPTPESSTDTPPGDASSEPAFFPSENSSTLSLGDTHIWRDSR